MNESFVNGLQAQPEPTKITVCAWCRTELPDDHVEWYTHHLIAHGGGGYSVSYIYPDDVEREFQRWQERRHV